MAVFTPCPRWSTFDNPIDFSLYLACGYFLMSRGAMSLCADLFEEMDSWLARGFSHVASLAGVRIKPSKGNYYVSGGERAVVSYLSGMARYPSEPGSYIEFDLRQSFSDRFAQKQQPFNADKKDDVTFRLFPDGRVQFVLNSWNDATYTFEGECVNNTLSGFDSDCFWFVDFQKELLDG
jgi:hypothetical protein